jgi:hypothetical protein
VKEVSRLMNEQKLRRRLQWYQICGTRVDNNLPVVALVEATSRQAVLKYFGGRRQQSRLGERFLIQFPADTKDVQPLGKYLKAECVYTASGVVIEVIPATRYQCSCGKEHISEHPYPGVWCSCGQRVLPTATTPTEYSA